MQQQDHKSLLRTIEQGKSDPVIFARGVLGIDLNVVQEQWLRESIKPGRKKNILVPANRVGKSVACAVKHLWHAFYKPQLKELGYSPEQIVEAKYPTLNVSPNLNQVRVMFNYMVQILKSEFMWVDEDGTGHKNECKIEWFLDKVINNPHPILMFKNNSIFSGRTLHDDMGRGLAGSEYAYISYDECPLSYHLKDEMGNLMSRLITLRGTLDLVGTPDANSQSSQYYMHIVKKGIAEKEGWFAMKGKLDDNKFLSEQTRDEAKKMLLQTDPEKYRQIVFGEFTEAGAGYFSVNQVENMFRDGVKWSQAYPDHNYVLACDWAVTKNDYTVFIVVDYTKKPFRIVHITRFQGNEFKPDEQYSIARKLQMDYNADVIVDSTGLGGAIIKEALSDIVNHAFNFGGSAGMKQEMLLALKEQLSRGDIICPYDAQLAEELGTYKEDDKRLTQDMVMALGMAAWYIKDNYTELTDRDVLTLDIFK